MTEKPASGFSLKMLSTIFAGGNFVSMALRMVGGILTARFIDPATLGLFNGMGLVLAYAPFLQLGVLNALHRELPYYIGCNESEHAADLTATAKAWAMLVGGMVATGLVGMALWKALQGEWTLAAGWLTYAFGAWVLFYGQLYMQTTYRTHGDFAKLAVINVAQNAIGLALVVLVALFGFQGLCLRFVLGGGAVLWLTWKWLPLRVSARWARGNLVHLLKVGAPIFIVGQLYAWWTVLDSTLVLKYAGAKGFGLYQLSLIAGQSVGILPLAVGQILYPRLAQEYGRSGRIADLVQEVRKPVFYMVLGAIPCLVVAWFLLPPVARHVLPKYVAGIEAAQWTLVAVATLTLAPVNNIFNVVRRQDLYLTAMIIGMISYGGVLWALTRNGVNLIDFPQAMLAGRSVFLVCCLVFVGYLVLRERRAEVSGGQPQ